MHTQCRRGNKGNISFWTKCFTTFYVPFSKSYVSSLKCLFWLLLCNILVSNAWIFIFHTVQISMRYYNNNSLICSVTISEYMLNWTNGDFFGETGHIELSSMYHHNDPSSHVTSLSLFNFQSFSTRPCRKYTVVFLLWLLWQHSSNRV